MYEQKKREAMPHVGDPIAGASPMNIPSVPPVPMPEQPMQDAVMMPSVQPAAETVFKAPEKLPIGREEILKAAETLMRYKEGKANLEARIRDNEEWYRLRHWECMRRSKAGLKTGEEEKVKPVSAWLFNSIANKHADAMDNFPRANVLPREEGDQGEAELLSSIMPVVMDIADYEKAYSEAWDDKLKSGTGVYGVFWDKSKHGGLGDITISCTDILSLYWESGVKDIQKSKNLFQVELVSNDELNAIYPQTVNKLSGDSVGVSHYLYDDKVDTADKSAVIDWYYKKRTVGGKTVLHYCKFVNDIVLFASENDPKYRERGWYDHGLYPFHFDVLFPVKGMPTGFGYIDVGKSAQEFIDRGNSAIMRNMLHNAAPRFFYSSASKVNMEQFADLNQEMVEVEGSLDNNSIIPMQGSQLGAIYLDVLNSKIEELKETTGNRDVQTGGTASGVTAAAAIAAMQEASGKLSRDANKASYRVFRSVANMVLELIRQFYTLPRAFRITGEGGAQEYITYTSKKIQPVSVGGAFGTGEAYRVPQFDIEVTAEKASAYSRLAQNELSLQFYNAGFFIPENADAALACLDMMDFDRKEKVVRKIQENGTLKDQVLMLQEQMLQLAAMVDAKNGTSLADGMAVGLVGEGTPAPVGRASSASGEITGGESHVTKNARERAAQTTAPR